METVFAYEYTPSARIRVTDEDSADFLQSQFSNDLKPFAEGQCTYGLWLDVKGKVLADSWVLCEAAEEFLVLSESSPVADIHATLEGHIIADDVELELLDSHPAIALLGAGAKGLLEHLGVTLPAAGHFTQHDGLIVFAGRRSLAPNFECIATSAEAGQRLREQLAGMAVEFVSRDRIQVERIAAGIPLVPDDIGPADLPGEGGFQCDAVSFTKGCFLGQEVVARMHNVGQARRGLYRVSGVGRLPEVPGSLATQDGKSAGALRTVVQTPVGWSGVALLKLRAAEETTLYSVGDQPVQVEGALRTQN
ncbi:MAG: YgfZ/GcvT domain-containing protein [Coraliomargarita sp.]